MRVLAVTQRRGAGEIERQAGRKRLVFGRLLLGEPGVDRGVVGCGALEGLARELAPRRLAEHAALAQLLEHRTVVAGIHDHADVRVILRGRANHRGSADVDLLDGFGARHIGTRDRLLERVQIHDDEVDRRDLLRRQIRAVVFAVAPRQDAAVDARVQRLDAAAQHLGTPRQRRDLGHLEPVVGQDSSGSARGDQLDAQLRQRPCELDETALVVDGKESSRDARLRRSRGHPDLRRN
jgi:hypothetical protein